MLVIFQFLPKSSLEEKHKHGNDHEENKKICTISLHVPDPKSFEQEECGYKQVSIFKIFKKLHHSFSLLLFGCPHWCVNEN